MVFLGAICSCANPVSLSGGEKDTQAPGIVKDGILPENEKIQFTKQPIYFTFDEWVKLDDVLNQVVISPPLEYNPKIKIKGKTVEFEFDEREELREETTYTINFGEAVKDLTEGNPAEDMRYVFSTGDQIDSLFISGRVSDAVEGGPMENALVMLYENLSDTVFRKERPYYFSRTDEIGNFKIQNLKKGRFQILVLANDQGQKYLFDNPEESIGFQEDFVDINDTSKIVLNLKTFKEKLPLQITEKGNPRFGQAVYAFNREPFDLDLSFSAEADGVQYETEKDSLYIWYDQTDSFAIYAAYDTLWYDTLEIKKRNKAAYVNRARLSRIEALRGSIKMAPREQVKVKFNHPIRRFEQDSIALLRDSTLVAEAFNVEIDTSKKRVLNISSIWQDLSTYNLFLYPGAVEDIYGLTNDTIRIDLLASEKKSFGEINLSIAPLEKDKAYVVELSDASNKLIDQFNIVSDSTFTKKYPYLIPTDYTLKIIEDANFNGRWDEGSFDLKKYPEKIFTQKLETLRANWSVEAIVKPTF